MFSLDHHETLGGELSPAHIPAHVITEDSIPPALEASAQAITSVELNPDEVEIVTSASHQPAVTNLESSASHADLTSLSSPVLQQKLQKTLGKLQQLLFRNMASVIDSRATRKDVNKSEKRLLSVKESNGGPAGKEPNSVGKLQHDTSTTRASDRKVLSYAGY